MRLTKILKHARGALAAVATAFLRFLRNQDAGARRWDGVSISPPPPMHPNCRCIVWPIQGDPRPRPGHYTPPPASLPAMFRRPYVTWARALNELERLKRRSGTSSREIARARMWAIITADRIRNADPRIPWVEQPRGLP